MKLIDISMEATTFIFMLMLLVACVIKKKKMSAMNAFIGMIVTEMLVLFCQISEWIVWDIINDGTADIIHTYIFKELFCLQF